MNDVVAVVFWIALLGGVAAVVYRFITLPRRLGDSVERLSSTVQQRHANKAAGQPVTPINYLGLAGLAVFIGGAIVARTLSAYSGLLMMAVGFGALLIGLKRIKAKKDDTG